MKIAVLAAALTLAAAPAFAQPGAILVSHAWIAAPPIGAPTAAAYVTFTNQGQTPDVLLGAETPAAEKIELHAMSMAGGIMRMRPATGGVALAPGQTLGVTPGGAYHFMVIRPKHPLRAGDRIAATLTFAKAGAVKTVFVVEAQQAAPHITLR
jgi:copper(I)-binding protein